MKNASIKMEVNRKGLSGIKIILCLLGCIILIGLYINGANRHSQLVNTDMSRTDQSAYMGYAENMAKTNYTFIGGRNRMPVYPFLQSFIYKRDMSDREFFHRGKQFNIVLSVVLLIIIFWLLLRYLPLSGAICLILILAFTVFIFKASYFQTELLFYFLNFCCFLLLNKMLFQPKWQWGVLTGVILGLAHLTKASVLVGLVLFLVIAILQGVYKIVHQKKNRLQTRTASIKEYILKDLVNISYIPIVFLITIYPYITTSNKVFGSYFYNVNSTFYIWYDSWDEVKKGTRAHGDRVGWPQMSPEEIPSMNKYLREHTVKQILTREYKGLRNIARTATHSYGYFKYFAIYIMFCLYILIANQRYKLIVREYAFLCLFNFMYFIIFLLLYAWYTPIASGNRLFLSQFLPLMFAFSFIICKLSLRESFITYKGSQINFANILAFIVAVLLFFDITIILQQKIVTMYGGN